MNYYQARQREKDGRWDFTVRNDDRIRPCGYCVPWKTIEILRERVREMGPNPHFSTGNERYDALVDRHKDNFHDDGHETPEEAAACYKRYLLDLCTHYSTGSKTKQPCVAENCMQYTTFAANVGGQLFWLCDTHRNREVVEGLYDAPHKIASSY